MELLCWRVSDSEQGALKMRKYLLALALFFAGLLLFGGALEAVRLGREKRWPVASGRVIDAKHFEADGSTWVQVKYRYTIDGTSYVDTSSVDTIQPHSVPTAYQEGAEVVVHYDASRPDHSYLEHAGYESPIALLVFGGIVLLFCSPFVARQALLFYADVMLRRARRHMSEGLAAIRQGQDEMDAMQARREDIPADLLEREEQAIVRAQEAQRMLKDVERQRSRLN
jgi:hypothetical protein